VSPARVLFTMTLAERLSGAEEVLWTFLRHVDRSRVEPSCLCVEGEFAREVAALGVRTWTIPGGRLREARLTVATVARMARVLRRERPDLAVHWLTKAQLYGGPAAALAGLAGRSAWWQHDFPTRRPGDRLAAALPAVAVGACSEAVAEAQRRVWPHRPAFAVRPGIEEPARADPAQLAQLRAGLGAPGSAALVGIVGRLIPWKGQHRFLQALARLRADGHDVHGLVVGGDAYGLAPGYPARLRRLARDLGLEERVTFTGHVESAAPWIELMDVSVNASAAEPFGVVLLEAMALGTPVVAVDSAGPREIVEPDRTGILVPDDGALATGMARLLADDDLRRRVVAAARARYRDRFTAARMTREMEDRFTRLADRNATEP